MNEKENIISVDLVNASGELLQASVDFDWQIRLGGLRLPNFNRIEGLCIVALSKSINTILTKNQMEKNIFEVHDQALSSGANPNTLMSDSADYSHTYQQAITNLAMRHSPFFDNLFVLNGSTNLGLLLFIDNFEHSSIENDKREFILESARAEGMSDSHLKSINRSIDREYKTRVRTALAKKEIRKLQVNQQISLRKDFQDEQDDAKRVSIKPTTTTNKEAINPEESPPKSNISETPKTEEKRITKQVTSSARPEINIEFDEVRLYSQMLYNVILNLESQTQFTVEEFKRRLESEGFKPKRNDIEKIIDLAHSKGLLLKVADEKSSIEIIDFIYTRK